MIRGRKIGQSFADLAGTGMTAPAGGAWLGRGAGPQAAPIVDPVNHEYYGTPGDDSFTAPTADAWYLSGQAGNDTLSGAGGDDLIIGGAGGDVLIGNGGADYYYVDTQFDLVYEAAGGGVDRILASVSYQLLAGQEIETLSTDFNAGTDAINLIGNDFVNIIIGNAGANTIDGRGGADLMIGFGGADYYYVNTQSDFVYESIGEGVDRVLASVSYQLAAGAEIETLSTDFNAGTDAIQLIGNEFVNIIIGNAGNNVLDGRGGADLLIGFGGNDNYYVNTQSDFVYESIGEGNDRVFASASFQLSAGAEIETLSTDFNAGTAAIDLTGNEFVNTIIGNAGANTLDGRGGADTMIGFAGDDNYYVDAAGDGVFETAGQGSDRVFASVSYQLAAGQEIETLSTDFNQGTGALTLTGNELANNVYGNAGNNVLDGRSGSDTLVGQGGQDVFAFTTALGAGNIDIVADFSVVDDTIRLGGNAGEPFTPLASGALAAASFVIGSGALDANDYLIYNSATGALLYDADGNGAGTAVQFATLSTGLALTAADFIVSGPVNTAPAITSGATASIAENSPVSTIVYQTQASDADGDRITYSLTGADAGLLTIDANGAVRLVTSANFEAKATYSFNVVASDSGTSTGKAVTLTITDVQEAATPIINETAAANDASGQAQVIDRNLLVVADNANLPNDDLPSATIQGSLSTNNDRDYYSITLQLGELLILDVDGTTGGLDSQIFVYGPNGVTEIGNNDDQGAFDPGSTGIATTHNTDSYFQFRAPSAGTYYFAIQSFQGENSGNYQINVSVGPPGTPQQILEEDRDALLSGSVWNRTDLTFGFPQTAEQYPSNFKEVSPTSEFQPFSALQQAATRSLIQLVANVSSLTFTELTGGTDPTSGAGSANLRYAMTTDPGIGAAYAYYPSNGTSSSPGGSAWFNTTSFNSPQRGNYAWMGILHETGHALGLKHGHEAPAVSDDHDSLEYTVMTYRAYPGASTSGGYTNEQFGFAQSLMMLDIAALQKMYGANFGTNATDSVYTWSETTGEMFINGAGQGAPGSGAGGNQNRVFLTIWDGNGTDTYDMSNYGGGVSIDLRPAQWSITSQTQLANLGGNANPIFARGNVANALQYNGDARSLIENAIGGAGNDSLTANEATNRLTGNGGTDTFKWAAQADGADLGGSADRIIDFARGTDKIDLSGVDAISGTSADDAFSFIGTSAFHNVAGELRYQAEGADLRIQGDIDGNGVSDFEIIVSNNTSLAGTDFVF